MSCAQVPPGGTHPCLLAAVFTRFDAPAAGKHVWEQNNLAQKNLTIVNLQPDAWFLLPFVIVHLKPKFAQATTIELLRPAKFAQLKASLVAPKGVLTAAQRLVSTPIGAVGDPSDAGHARDAADDVVPTLDCGCADHASVQRARLPRLADAASLADADTGTLETEFPGGFELPFGAGERAALPVKLRPLEPTRVGLRFQLPADAPVGARFVLDVVQRVGKQVVGGVAIEVNVVR